jgi:hypothetical protein
MLARFTVLLMDHVKGVHLGSGHARAPAEQCLHKFVHKHEQVVTRIVIANFATYSDLSAQILLRAGH